MPELRDYQVNLIERVERLIAEGTRRILVVAPTGSGKTVIFSELIARHNGKVLILAHREELIKQTAAKLWDAGVQDHGIIKAGYEGRPQAHVQVASIQTLHARAVRSMAMDMPDADMVIIDESHRSRARTYEEIVSRFPEAIILGFTATPCRKDGRGLGNVFDILVEAPDVSELTKAGYLVPAVVYAPSQPDLKGLKVQAGDYVEREIASVMDKAPLIGDAITHWFRHAKDRRTVAFCSGVEHSIHVAEEFNKAGVPAVHIDGTTPKEEREAALKNLAADRIKIITNDSVLTEGWDSPLASCAILLRPTRSLGLFRQMIGRVLRPADGKTDALILDHAGAVFEHGLPDDPIEWTLKHDQKAANRRNDARKKGKGKGRLTTCPKCTAIRLGGEGCHVCGWKPERQANAVEVQDGDLALVTGKAHEWTKAEKDRWHRELTGIALDRGYKSGWVAHKFKEKFGSFPPWGPVAPLDPSPEILSWVRSRFIAYAKAKEKSGSKAQGEERWEF